jgi:hypothetical protein
MPSAGVQLLTRLASPYFIGRFQGLQAVDAAGKMLALERLNC